MKNLSPGTLILGIFAVLFGLVGAYAVKSHLQAKPEPAPPAPIRQLTVPLASVDLTPGRTITMGDVVVARMTRDEIKKRNLPADFMTYVGQVIGRTLREPIGKGDAFLISSFYPEGLGPDVADRLAAGYRAVTIPVADESTEVGLISPGASVDVLFRSLPDPSKRLPETTVTLLESVDVLAVGSQTFEGARSDSSGNRRRQDIPVTLAVTPKQAGALKVVEGRGSVSLVLRGGKDMEMAENPTPQTLAGLLGLSIPKKPFATEIYRRGSLTTTVFEEDGPTVVQASADLLPVRTAGENIGRGRDVSLVSATTRDLKQQEPCGCQDE